MIYIAAPFFNPQQLQAVRTVESILKRTKFKFFSPRLHSVDVGTLSEEERKSGKVMTDVFKGNIEALDNSNLLLACIDKSYHPRTGHRDRNADAGTMFEIGYFYREAMFGGGRGAPPFDGAETVRNQRLRNKNILTWSSEGGHTNLMFSQAVGGHLSTLMDVEKYFNHVRTIVKDEELARDTWFELNGGFLHDGTGFSFADVEEEGSDN